MEGWVRIYSSNFEPRVQLVKARLEHNRIPVVVVNKQDRNYLFGDIELYVKPDHVIAAKRLIGEEV